MDNLNIFSVSGFIFFLLIIGTGYSLIEIVLGEKYWFRKVLEKNKNSIFDRILHYIVFGVIIHAGFITLILASGTLGGFLESFNQSGKIAELMPFLSKENIIQTQVVIFSCCYFLFLIFSLGIFGLAYNIGYFLATDIYKTLSKKITD